MDFQPFFAQLIPHPTHKFLLANPLALAAFGEPDHRIRKFRPNLVEGTHFLFLPDEQRRQRLYYTVAGLLDLATRLDTERSREFRDCLISQFSNLASGKLAVREVSSIQTAEVLPTEIIPTRLEQPSISPNLVHSPQLAELLQLKREELQLQRNAQEIERLKILRDAIKPREESQVVGQGHPNPITRADDPAGQSQIGDSKAYPFQIHVENNLDASSYGHADIAWLKAFAMWLIAIVMILGMGMGFVAMTTYLSRQSGGSSYVR